MNIIYTVIMCIIFFFIGYLAASIRWCKWINKELKELENTIINLKEKK